MAGLAPAEARGGPARRRIAEAALILFAALALRLVYLALVYHGADSLRLPDSSTYEAAAAALLGIGGPVDWTARMPGYPLFLAAVRLLAGPDPLWPVLVQLCIDSVSCLLIGVLAAALDRRLALPAGLLAAINLNMVTTAAAILTESLFLVPFIAGLIAAVSYVKAPSWRRAAAAGLCLGLALLVRSVLLFYLPVLLIALALAAWHRRVAPGRAAGHILAAAGLAVLCVAPVALDNLARWDRLALVSQGGRHALLWVAPAAREFVLGVPFEQGQLQMTERLADALKDRHLAALPTDPFAAAGIEEAVASRALWALGVGGLAKAWLAGIAINLFAPTLVAVPPIAALPRPHFYDTAGGPGLGKVLAFAQRALGTAFFWLMVPAVLWTALCRAAALGALWRLGRRGGLPLGPTLYLAAVAAYFLLITGPVAGVKYRLPLEPILTVLLASALVRLADWWRGRRSRRYGRIA